MLEAVAITMFADADTRGWAVLCAVSAESRLEPDLLRMLRGRKVRILPDAGEAGRRGMERWALSLKTAGVDVDAFTLPGDLKDLGPIAANMEEHRETIEEIFTL
jgi:hypothetical protein